jgi:hypothetical protein
MCEHLAVIDGKPNFIVWFLSLGPPTPWPRFLRQHLGQGVFICRLRLMRIDHISLRDQALNVELDNLSRAPVSLESGLLAPSGPSARTGGLGLKAGG